MPALTNQTGKKVGRWLVLRRVRENPGRRDRRVWWLCKCECGTEKLIPANVLNDGRSKSCGCLKLEQMKAKTREKNKNWKGGRREEKGYVLIYHPDHHRAKRNGYTREHFVVMEKKIGRLLRPNENVHHVNGVKNDNRPENLELWAIWQPSGQRVQDLVAWARNILEVYGEEY